MVSFIKGISFVDPDEYYNSKAVKDNKEMLEKEFYEFAINTQNVLNNLWNHSEMFPVPALIKLREITAKSYIDSKKLIEKYKSLFPEGGCCPANYNCFQNNLEAIILFTTELVREKENT